jgi:hypothetical protein
MKRILFLFIIFLVSCRSLDSSQFTVDSLYSQRVSHADLSTINYQLSTARDSIVYREKVVHDTVFITKEVYRASQLSTVNSQLSTKSDTVVVTEYRDRVIEHPPERYVPKFYKWCTIALWVIGLLAIGYGLLRWYLRR